MKSTYTALRIPPDLLVKAKERAAADGRSFSNYIKNLLRLDLIDPQVDETRDSNGAMSNSPPIPTRFDRKKDSEIAARVDGRTKAELQRLAYSRGLDVSDLIREAVRDLLAKEQSLATRLR